ncbi:acetyl esterase/lipase [Nocardia sp. GAS34]|uniref:alpha/beta hydrolase n=1 Tax=unclassified Nocardia TaxID=2637762 RepID=UPI003D232CDB
MSTVPEPGPTVIFGPDAVTDPDTAREVLGSAFAQRGLAGDVRFAGDAHGFDSVIRSAAPDSVVVPGVVRLAEVPGAEFVHVDLVARDRIDAGGVRTYIRGRGLDGLRYAVDAWYFHRLRPATLVSYGERAEQVVDVRTPAGPGPHPVAVLIHGGYWKPWWDRDLMDAAAVDLTARGFATWNIEYRRPGAHGWDATTADVAAALAAIGAAPASFDRDRVVVLGHSAGGQLALRAGADAVASGAPVRPALLVSLAGVLDLRTADERGLGDGAVQAALGHRYHPASEVYRSSSPLERVPIGIPQVAVCGDADVPDLREITRHYARRATAAGDRVELVQPPGDHFAVIDPRSESWRRTIEAMTASLHRR